MILQLSKPYPTKRFLWLAYGFVAIGFLPALDFYYVGEEAIFPITSLEMWQHKEWLRQLFYGADMQHNPLFNWLIIPLSTFTGWGHMLVVARALTITATLLSGLLVAWLARRLFRDSRFAAFAALTYLTLADVLLYRGWLAYVDPLFALLVFAAMAALWVACLGNSRGWLVAAGVALTGAFLAKAFTAYVFYGAAGLVLLVQYRRFLLSPFSLLLHGLMMLAPLAWLALLSDGHGQGGQGGRMFSEIVAKLNAGNWVEYATKLAVFPAETLLRLAPVALVVIYLFLRRRINQEELFSAHFRVALWIAVINYLPYWLAPQSNIRYLMPIYPLFALVLARLAWRAGEDGIKLTLRWLAGFVVLKLVLVLGVFPYYQRHYRGENYALAAADIQRRSANYPLYTTDVSASGLSVTAYLDVLRLPASALTTPPATWDSGFVLAYTDNPALGQSYHRYVLGGNDLYLLCRGAACTVPK